MGLLQKAYETYENHRRYVGEYSSEDREFISPLAPIGHLTKNVQIEVTIHANGEFRSASAVPAENQPTIIPATEESAGRTSNVCPHPLCDKIEYVSLEKDADERAQRKYEAYKKQLAEWADSEHGHPMLNAILKYVEGNTLHADLKRSGIKENLRKGDKFVRWIVNGLPDRESSRCWENKALFKAFQDYYLSKKESRDERVLCMVTGETDLRARQHPGGIVAMNGTAKLVSSNDTTNFTYRGRFCSDTEALTIGYHASQKAHNALKWVIGNQRVFTKWKKELESKEGGRAFVCWNPEGKKIYPPIHPLRRNRTPTMKLSDYREDLRRILYGYGKDFRVSDGAVIATFDAASQGRLSLLYYREVAVGELYERLREWDETCCWIHNKYGISSPSIGEIVNCAFGAETKIKTVGKKGKKEDEYQVEAAEKIRNAQMQRLLAHRIDGHPMPYDIVRSIAEKTKRPLAYQEKREFLQFTACAVIRKYYIDQYKEEYDMALEKDKKDLSYQYGRLLAILERAERLTYDDAEKREPNAIRLQSAFCAHPAQTAKILIERVKTGYYPKLKVGTRIFFENLICEIYGRIAEFPEAERNRPLKETYIMGYYLQKNELQAGNRKNDQRNETNETEESENE